VVESSLAEQIAEVVAGKSDQIHVSTTPLVDADLIAIGDAQSLRVLMIDHDDSRMTAAGMRHLAGLPHLKHLRIRGAGIDDEALAEVANIQALEILNLPRGAFTDAGLLQLKDLPRLESLRFGTPHVTTAGIASLATFPALKRLHLIDIPIGDDGLRSLARMEQLESLYIDGGEFSDVALDELFQARPQLHVHLNQQHSDRDPRGHAH
jgi:hypothetical protein